MAAELTTATTGLAHLLAQRFPDDAARLVERAEPLEAATLVSALPAPDGAALLERLSPDPAVEVLLAASPEAMAPALAAMQPQRAAAMLARLDEDALDRLLAPVDGGAADELRALMRYSPDTAGGLMSPRVTSFRPGTTVDDVLASLRSLEARSPRRVQDVFVVDAQGHLVGAVPLQEVVLASREQTLETLYCAPPPSVRATASREEVVGELERHKAGSLAVVDFEGRLLGALRQEHLIGAAQREATAKALTMVGASKEERALSSPWFAVKKRLPWLQINLVTAFIAASVVSLFEETIARNTALAVLLPVVAGQSGNTGAQALAVTMRGLALREVRVAQWARVALKEMAAAAVNGVAVAGTTALAVYFWSNSAGLSLVIGVSMVISMVAAGLSGAVIPMVLTAIGQDPAQSSSIVLTTVTDVAGFFSFLGIATLLSSML